MNYDSAAFIFFYGLSLGGVMGLFLGLGLGVAAIVFSLAECLI